MFALVTFNLSFSLDISSTPLIITNLSVSAEPGTSNWFVISCPQKNRRPCSTGCRRFNRIVSNWIHEWNNLQTLTTGLKCQYCIDLNFGLISSITVFCILISFLWETKGWCDAWCIHHYHMFNWFTLNITKAHFAFPMGFRTFTRTHRLERIILLKLMTIECERTLSPCPRVNTTCGCDVFVLRPVSCVAGTRFITRRIKQRANALLEFRNVPEPSAAHWPVFVAQLISLQILSTRFSNVGCSQSHKN